MVQTIEALDLESLKTEKLGGMMAGVEASGIEDLDQTRKSAILRGLAATFFGADAREFAELAAGRTKGDTRFDKVPEAASLSGRGDAAPRSNFFQAGDLFATEE